MPSAPRTIPVSQPSQIIAPASTFATVTTPSSSLLLDLTTPPKVLTKAPGTLSTRMYHQAPTSPRQHLHLPSNPPSPNDSGLQPYQIFLIVFFGLASIPVSVAFFWCIGSLRKRSLKHADEWSSSVWKRRIVPQPPPEKSSGSGPSDVVGAVGRRLSSALGAFIGYDASKARLGDIREGDEEQGQVPQIGGLGSVASPLGGGDSRRPVSGRQAIFVQETEVGRAWARPRIIENDPDGWRVVTLPDPPDVSTPPRVAKGKGKGNKTWRQFRANIIDGEEKPDKWDGKDSGYG